MGKVLSPASAARLSANMALALTMLLAFSIAGTNAYAIGSGYGGKNKDKHSSDDASFTPMPLDSGFGPLDSTTPSVAPEEIIRKFTAKESQFRAALNHYTYKRTARYQTVGDDNKVDGEFFEVDDVLFDPSGRRIEKVEYAPANTLVRVIMTPSDMQDLQRTPTMLTAEEAPGYDIQYAGKQQVDEVSCYVFDVKPKTLEKGKRYFQGRIWVDSDETQIVVMNGKMVPDDTRKGHEDLSPPLMTWRQQIDGQYWFPVYTKAEGILHFPSGNGYLGEDVHVRQTVKYTDYKRYGSSVKLIFDGQEVPNESKQQNQTPQNSQPTPHP